MKSVVYKGQKYVLEAKLETKIKSTASMKIFEVVFTSEDDEETNYLFSTKEKAEAFIEEELKHHDAKDRVQIKKMYYVGVRTVD